MSLSQLFARLRDAIDWRVRRLIGDRAIYMPLKYSAMLWRSLLLRPAFIGIVGSAGKTTAKELLFAVLSRSGKGVASAGSLNNFVALAYTLWRVRPWHKFCIAELSENQPGVMREQLALLRPSIGIVTVVRDDHMAAFASRDALAAEMAKLVASLPATGTAILNADDEQVLAMATLCAAKVVTFGLSPTADLRAEDISSVWPDRLQLTLVHGAERVKLVTKLCGTHWIPSVLGAIGGGLATGMTLEECAAGIAMVAPFEGRMQPVTTSDGVTFIRDDFKAPLWTLDACFDFMKAAKAKRKIIVIGELQEVGSRKGEKYAKAAQRAQEVTDITIFVGAWASNALKARKPGREGALHVFNHVWDAATFVNRTTRAGDLVLLKGANKQDHLLRIILARDGGVACWREDCQRPIFCNGCPDRMKLSGQLPVLLDMATAAQASHPGFVTLGPEEHVIVGLGNPEAKYSNTPHNIGYETLDHLATSLALEWDAATPMALVARGSWNGHRICLVKVQTAMNLTGEGLKQLAESMSFNPTQCILVYDDLDLPLGTVRTRMSGSAGGHRGVASILEAFQSDGFRRVKVGFAMPGQAVNRGELVLRRFDAQQRGAVDAALELAQAALHTMLKNTEIASKR